MPPRRAPQPAPTSFPTQATPDYRGGEAEVEVRDEIGAQADAGEKERREDVGDDGVDVFRGPFSKMARFTNGNPGDESSKDGMDSGEFREGRTGKSQREDET